MPSIIFNFVLFAHFNQNSGNLINDARAAAAHVILFVILLPTFARRHLMSLTDELQFILACLAKVCYNLCVLIFRVLAIRIKKGYCFYYVYLNNTK